MVIDFHTHTFPAKIAASALEKLSAMCRVTPHTNGTADELLQSMRESGIDRSVVLPVATAPRQVRSINDAAIHTADPSILSFAAMHPDYDDWEAELHRIAELGIPGIKIHPVYQGVDQDDPRYIRILRCAGALGLIVVTHAGVDIGYPELSHCTPTMLRRAIDQADNVTLVAAHMGGWQCWQEAAALLKDTPVYFDTAFSAGVVHCTDGTRIPLMDDAAFVDTVRALGANRILFGTDSPWASQRESLRHFLSMPLTADEQQAILSGNALRLLRI